MKVYHPLETAEYDVDQEINHEPEFKWWVKVVLKKRWRIISLFKKRNTQYLKNTHKFGIEVHRSVGQEYALYKNNGDTLWADDIANEMKDVIPAFKKL